MTTPGRWKVGSGGIITPVAPPKFFSAAPGGNPNQKFFELDPKISVAGFSMEESGGGPPAEEIYHDTTNDWIYSAAGGYTAGTHYARIKKRMPEAYGNQIPRDYFEHRFKFWVPADFYSGGYPGPEPPERDPGYLRFFNVDNFRITVNNVTYGADTDGEWRTGIFNQVDRKIQFFSTSQKSGSSDCFFWESAAEWLPVNTIVDMTYGMVPRNDNTGSWFLWINGVLIDSDTNVRTVPAVVNNNEIEVTRVNFCYDGMANQDAGTRQLTMRGHYGSFLWNV